MKTGRKASEKRNATGWQHVLNKHCWQSNMSLKLTYRNEYKNLWAFSFLCLALSTSIYSLTFSLYLYFWVACNRRCLRPSAIFFSLFGCSTSLHIFKLFIYLSKISSSLARNKKFFAQFFMRFSMFQNIIGEKMVNEITKTHTNTI